MKKISIAIDGPASAGKSTVAKRIAQELSYIYCDTGAMYRALTYEALVHNVDIYDEEALLKLLNQIEITFSYQRDGQIVLVNGKDVTKEIRNNSVTANVSQVSSLKKIREKLVHQQQSIAKNGGVVMDGRDIGTVVLPDAEVKIFLVASVEERAKRRYQENQLKGIECDLRTLQESIEQRDFLDSNRENSPLVQAKDAILVDTTNSSATEVVDIIKKQVENYLKTKV